MSEENQDNADIPQDVYTKIIGENLLRARASKRLSRRYLADESFMSQRTIYLIEHGRSNCGIYTLHQLALSLNINVADLLPSPLQLIRAKRIINNG